MIISQEIGPLQQFTHIGPKTM